MTLFMLYDYYRNIHSHSLYKNNIRDISVKYNKQYLYRFFKKMKI